MTFTRIPRVLLALGLLLLVTAILSGCGSDGQAGDDSQVSQAPKSSANGKAAFVRRVNAICGEGRMKLLNAMVGYEEAHPGVPRARVGRDAIHFEAPPALRSMLSDIHALPAPAGGASPADAYLAALARTIRIIERDRPASLDELQKAFGAVHPAALAAGLDECDYAG